LIDQPTESQLLGGGGSLPRFDQGGRHGLARRCAEAPTDAKCPSGPLRQCSSSGAVPTCRRQARPPASDGGHRRAFASLVASLAAGVREAGARTNDRTTVLIATLLRATFPCKSCIKTRSRNPRFGGIAALTANIQHVNITVEAAPSSIRSATPTRPCASLRRSADGGGRVRTRNAHPVRAGSATRRLKREGQSPADRAGPVQASSPRTRLVDNAATVRHYDLAVKEVGV
jgi:hypothetical protein